MVTFYWPTLYLRISHLTGEKVGIDNNQLTMIQEHYSPSFEDFFILTKENNVVKLKIMENLPIAREKSVLKKVDSLLTLELF